MAPLEMPPQMSKRQMHLPDPRTSSAQRVSHSYSPHPNSLAWCIGGENTEQEIKLNNEKLVLRSFRAGASFFLAGLARISIYN